jgi:putative membrane protein
MRTRTLLAAAGGLAVAFAAAPLSALHSQTPAQDSAANRTWGTHTGPIISKPTARADIAADSLLISQAILANQQEMRLGTLAQQKAASPAVKQFGQRMVTDHSTMGKQWSALAAQNGLSIKPNPDPTQTEQTSNLQSLSGTAFDRLYMTAMIQGHQRVVSDLQSQASSAKSAEVRQLSASELPIVQQHLTLATQVGSQVGATTDVAVVPTPPPATPGTTQTTTQPGQVATQPGQAAPQRTASADLKADRDFLQEVAADNLLEVRLADLAQRKAKDPSVKQFARQMQGAFTQAQNRWTGMSARNGLTIKPSMGRLHQQKVDRVQRASGANFDRVYMQTVIQHLQSIVPYFENEGRSASSPQVRRLVGSELPSLRQSLALAKRTGAQVKADTTESGRNRSVSDKK